MVRAGDDSFRERGRSVDVRVEVVVTEVRMSFLVWQDDPAIIGKQTVDYTVQWKNFSASIWNNAAVRSSGSDAAVGSPRIRQILREDYNARSEQNDVIFATSEDAVRFILRWS